MSKKKAQVSWIAVYYSDVDDPKKNQMTEEKILKLGVADPAPARDFLNSRPPQVKAALQARVAAVRDYPPISFPTSTPVWSLMHKPKSKKEVDMSGIFEVRDKHGSQLYRLFCVLDTKAPDHGLSAPALVMLSGTEKPVGTVVSQAIYKEVRAQADRYFSTSPRPTVI